MVECLRAPLARRSAWLGQLVGFEFTAWLELAERHNLDVLKCYCLVGLGGSTARQRRRSAQPLFFSRP